MTKKKIFKVVKCPLKSVLKNYINLEPLIDNIVITINKFVILGYQFIRSYLLYKFKNNLTFPVLDKTFILYVLKTIGTTNNRKSAVKNKELKLDLDLFYQNIFSSLVKEKLCYSNKTYLLDLTALEMLKSIKTNVSTHFCSYLFKYINSLFKDPKVALIKLEKDKLIRKEMFIELNKEIKNLKFDLINNQISVSKKEYHSWINDNKKYLFPENIVKTVAYDVKIDSQTYLIFAFYINAKIEGLNKKPFQVIPQRNTLVPKNIVLNTAGISAYLYSNYPNIFDYSKTKIKSRSKIHQKHIWSKILKLEKKSIFQHNDYIFFNQIATDGFSCSILFILKKYKDKKYFSRLPKETTNDTFIRNINSLTKFECENYLSDQYILVGLDPGKIRPISMVDTHGTFYKYSAHRRRFETYTKTSAAIILAEKAKYSIGEKESRLADFSSRTLDVGGYFQFLKKKNEVNSVVEIFYSNILFRKLAFRRFTKTKQSENSLLNEIEKKFLTKEQRLCGKNLLIFYGDYSRTSQMLGTIPAPNIGFKRLLFKKFELLEVDEYNTSKLYNKNFQELKKVSIKKNKHRKLLHEILTLKEETEWRIFVNRDRNACKNLLYLGKYFLEHQLRPKEFSPN